VVDYLFLKNLWCACCSRFLIRLCAVVESLFHLNPSYHLIFRRSQAPDFDFIILCMMFLSWRRGPFLISLWRPRIRRKSLERRSGGPYSGSGEINAEPPQIFFTTSSFTSGSYDHDLTFVRSLAPPSVISGAGSIRDGACTPRKLPASRADKCGR
jgi:hypothetical protein